MVEVGVGEDDFVHVRGVDAYFAQQVDGIGQPGAVHGLHFVLFHAGIDNNDPVVADNGPHEIVEATTQLVRIAADKRVAHHPVFVPAIAKGVEIPGGKGHEKGSCAR
jgi:hypothetical protein